MNIIEKSICIEEKKNQKNISKFKIFISIFLLFLFGILFFIFHFQTLYFVLFFLLYYSLITIFLFFTLDLYFKYYKYIIAIIDIIGIYLLAQIVIHNSSGLIYSLYFIPFLITVIVISGFSFQKIYTILFGFFSFLLINYLLFLDKLLDKYSVIVIFFFLIIYFSSIYNSFNLKNIVNNVVKLKQLEKFNNKTLLSEIEKNPDILIQEGKEKELVIMFLDIKGFSHLSEKLDVKEIFSILNKYLGDFSTIIESHNGVVDKYIGDCIMGIFDGRYKVSNSYKASKNILERLSELNIKLSKNIGIGIGLHIGKVYVGGIGNKDRMDYTIIGDNVNIASRLESLTRQIDGDIIVSKDYYNRITFKNDFSFAGNFILKGKENKIDVFKI